VNSFQQISFYSGNTSKPFDVSVEIDRGNIYIIDTEQTELPLYFALKECHYNRNNNKVFVYLNKQATAYLLIQEDNPHWETIRKEIDQYKKGITHSLMRLNWLSLSAIVIGLFAFLYLCSTYIIPTIGMKVISAKQETSMGESLYNSMIEEETVDSALTVELGRFAGGLQLSGKYKIKVTVINDVKNPKFNAFAMPGGHIVVYMSLLDKMNTSGELVALLSHESSHVNYRHSLRTMLTNLSSSVLLSIVTSGMGSGGALLTNANTFRMMSYSRNLEREADEQGMHLMVDNKINPKGMKMLMESLQKAHDDIPSSLSFISSHPLTKERIKNADQFVSTHDTTNVLNAEREQTWKNIKNNLMQ